MVRKKKKKKDEDADAFRPPQESRAAAKDDDDAARTTVVDLLPMLLKPCSSTSSTITTTSSPKVFVNAADAALLDVGNHNEVILLLNATSSDEGGEQSSVAAVVAQVQQQQQQQQQPRASPARASPRKMASILPPGNIQLTSQTLVDCLLSTSRSKKEAASFGEEASVATTDAASPVFFKTGAVEDKFMTPSPRSNQSQQSTVNVSMIACHSTLGQQLLHQIGATCTKLLLIVARGEHQKQNQSQILQRLIIAHCHGRYVQVNQVLRISFRGQPAEFRVMRAENNRHDNTNGDDDAPPSLDDQFSRLKVDDDNDDDSCLWSHEALSLLAATKNSSKLLYKITYQTKVEFWTDDEVTDSTEKELGTKVTNNSNDKSPKQYVVGLSSTLQEVRSLLLLPLTRPELFQNNNQSSSSTVVMKAPRGVLLHGPSGVGKSAMALQIAEEIRHCLTDDCITVEHVNCASLQSQTAIVGQAERQLTRLFHPSSPSSDHNSSSVNKKLLIFDDIHLICPRRGGIESGSTDRLAATLLALLDGIGSTKTANAPSSDATTTTTIVVLAITSNPSLLDPALRRPGRLDAEVEVPIPDEASTRAEILRFHCERLGGTMLSHPSMNMIDEEGWMELAKLAKGFNGADCVLAVKEAIRSYVLKDSRGLKNTTTSEDKSKQAPSVSLTFETLKAAIRSIQPSAIKSITVEIPQVHWTSIGGMDSVKRELREAIELPLTHGEYFEQLGVPPPRGILLYGPPGCSKTLMARALATEGHMNFLAVKGPELLSKWLGESERALASLFRRARMASPSIIFFDEIDAIASKRGTGDSASSGRLLSQLLTELDGVNQTGSAAGKKKQRVVVVGATNRPDLLDNALTRPGRIDRMIYVGVPDADSRARILQLSLENKSCGKDIDIGHLASDEVSQGYSGAEIVAVCRDAALLALEEGDSLTGDVLPRVEMRHLLSAFKDMQRQITPEMIDFYASYNQDERR